MTSTENSFEDFEKYFQNKIRDLLTSRIDAIADGDFEAAEEIDLKISRLRESVENNRISLSVDERHLLSSEITNNDMEN
jgi:hypothetical protein